jgi:uncharacterized repeat protein (TIGR02543 family)
MKMNRKRAFSICFSLAILLLAVVFIMTGCSGPTEEYGEAATVTFNYGIGIPVEIIQAGPGDTIDKPSRSLDGSIVTGWYEDSAYITQWNFSTAIYADKTLYAKWEPGFYAATPGEWTDAINDIAGGGDNKDYTIALTGDLIVPGSIADTFGSAAGITVTITGNHTLKLSSSGRLLTIVPNQDVTLQDVELAGYTANDNSLVGVYGGSVTMKGNSSISGNTIPNGHGAGVYIDSSGTFTMGYGVAGY